MRLERLGLGVLILGTLAGCRAQRQAEDQAVRLTGGDPDRGRWAIRQYGCASCHSVPGVVGADGLVGPPLDRIGARMVLAGHLPNNPANMVRWIRHPRQVRPDTAMPDTGLGEPDARDIAAYLYTLR